MLRLATMQDLTRIMAIVQATVMEMHAYGNYQWDARFIQLNRILPQTSPKAIFLYQKLKDRSAA